MFGIDQMPWHLDAVFAGSVFMFFGNEFKRVHILLKKSRATVLNTNIIVIPIIIVLVLISTVFILLNDRVIMVLNHYGNIVLFLCLLR